MKNLKEYIITENKFFKNLGVGHIKLIKDWLEENEIFEYTINDDLTIDVEQDVNLKGYKETELPEYIQFGYVSGYFDIYESPKLKSLRGCPQVVGENFDCENCKNLTTLEGGPESVFGDFNCSICPKLKSLEGSPKIIESGGFYCSHCNDLTSLEGCPQEVNMSFSCAYCKNLTSLKGCPQVVGENFDCENCKKLTSLEGAPREVYGDFYCKKCGVKFTDDDVEKYCDVSGYIIG